MLSQVDWNDRRFRRRGPCDLGGIRRALRRAGGAANHAAGRQTFRSAARHLRRADARCPALIAVPGGFAAANRQFTRNSRLGF